MDLGLEYLLKLSEKKKTLNKVIKVANIKVERLENNFKVIGGDILCRSQRDFKRKEGVDCNTKVKWLKKPFSRQHAIH